MEELAEQYLRDQYIDFGDLNEKAEQQIKRAFIDGMKKAITVPNVGESFHGYIINRPEKEFYAKLIKPYANHEVGRIYYFVKQLDNSIYSGDSRGTGQGGCVSNVIDTLFEPSNKALYEAQ